MNRACRAPSPLPCCVREFECPMSGVPTGWLPDAHRTGVDVRRYMPKSIDELLPSWLRSCSISVLIARP